ncbi:hypothetical protein [Dyadobacter diqingensis]|uniref:hypothetical protein n=1 Tax=Dyadobacter diqingensis TaxID=2938121 RepID=UPI0020C41331|nr:hypothetical protein [Dyadobacter diqingensis]
MKKLLLLLTLTTFIFSCTDKDKKDPEPAPELSTLVQGSYKATKLKIDGENKPLVNGRSITMVFTKSTATEVNGIMKYTTEDGDSGAEDLGDVLLKDKGDNGIDLYDGSEKVGNVSKDNLLTVSVFSDGSQIDIVATKK